MEQWCVFDQWGMDWRFQTGTCRIPGTPSECHASGTARLVVCPNCQVRRKMFGRRMQRCKVRRLSHCPGFSLCLKYEKLITMLVSWGTSVLRIVKLREEVSHVLSVIEISSVVDIWEVVQILLILPDPQIGRHSSDRIISVFQTEYKLVQLGTRPWVTEIWWAHDVEGWHHVVSPDVLVWKFQCVFS